MTSARNNLGRLWLAAALLACCVPVLASIPAVRPLNCELRTPAVAAVADVPALETDADGTPHRFVRDAAGNPVYEVRRDGTVIGREFDTLNRLTSVWTLPPGTATNPGTLPSTIVNAQLRQTFEYDALSRLVRAVDYNDPTTPHDDRETTYAYDSLGRIVSETEDGRAIVSVWDARSNRCAVTYPSGRTVTVDYDAASRPVTVTDAASAEAFDLEYDAVSRLACVRAAGVRQRIEYYANGSEPIRYFDRKVGANYVEFASLDVTGYDFRNLANGDYRGIPNLTSNSTYGYDNRGSLTGATTTGAGAHTATWILDKAGNWTSWLVVPPSGGPGTTTTYTPNPDNEYTLIDATTPTYDANGNLTAGIFPRPLGEGQGEGTQMEFAYDWSNRLIAVTADSVTVATYTYDAFNRRITATTADGVTRSVYDGSRLIEEHNARTPAAPPRRAHVYGVDRVPVFSVDAAGTVRYLLTDRQDSVVALTDAAGNVQELYRYTPYGDMTVCAPSGIPLDTRHSTLNPSFAFTGQRFDPESGLWDFRNRAYSAELGRFLQRDPAGFIDGYNTYLYCRNSPVNFIDPDGRRVRAFGGEVATHGFASTMYAGLSQAYGYLSDYAGDADWAFAGGALDFGSSIFGAASGVYDQSRMTSAYEARLATGLGGYSSAAMTMGEELPILNMMVKGAEMYDGVSLGAYDTGRTLTGMDYTTRSLSMAGEAVLWSAAGLSYGSAAIDRVIAADLDEAFGGFRAVTGDGAGWGPRLLTAGDDIVGRRVPANQAVTRMARPDSKGAFKAGEFQVSSRDLSPEGAQSWNDHAQMADRGLSVNTTGADLNLSGRPFSASVGSVEAIREGRLKVVHDPIPGNPNHALIVPNEPIAQAEFKLLLKRLYTEGVWK